MWSRPRDLLIFACKILPENTMFTENVHFQLLSSLKNNHAILQLCYSRWLLGSRGTSTPVKFTTTSVTVGWQVTAYYQWLIHGLVNVHFMSIVIGRKHRWDNPLRMTHDRGSFAQHCFHSISYWMTFQGYTYSGARSLWPRLQNDSTTLPYTTGISHEKAFADHEPS